MRAAFGLCFKLLSALKKNILVDDNITPGEYVIIKKFLEDQYIETRIQLMEEVHVVVDSVKIIVLQDIAMKERLDNSIARYSNEREVR